MSNHTFLFSIGAHHSGTTILELLLCQHKDASCLQRTRRPMNEGQHVQNVYKAANRFSSATGFHKHPEAFMDETDYRVTRVNRFRLFDAWARFWKGDRRVLLEKSPRHITMTRFLQAMFSRSHSRFLVILRHPLGSAHFYMRKAKFFRQNCARSSIEHWLVLHETLERDAAFLEACTVFNMELFLGANHTTTQAMMDAMYRFAGLAVAPPLTFSDESPAPALVPPQPRGIAPVNGSRIGRHLLGYHTEAGVGRLSGPVKLLTGHAQDWTDDIGILLDRPVEECRKEVWTDLEPRVRRFGYSLDDFGLVGPASALADYMLEYA